MMSDPRFQHPPSPEPRVYMHLFVFGGAAARCTVLTTLFTTFHCSPVNSFPRLSPPRLHRFNSGVTIHRFAGGIATFITLNVRRGPREDLVRPSVGAFQAGT